MKRTLITTTTFRKMKLCHCARARIVYIVIDRALHCLCRARRVNLKSISCVTLE